MAATVEPAHGHVARVDLVAHLAGRPPQLGLHRALDAALADLVVLLVGLVVVLVVGELVLVDRADVAEDVGEELPVLVAADGDPLCRDRRELVGVLGQVDLEVLAHLRGDGDGLEVAEAGVGQTLLELRRAVTSFGRSAPVTTVPAGAVVVVVLDAGGSVVVELAVPPGSAVVDVVWAPGSPEGS